MTKFYLIGGLGVYNIKTETPVTPPMLADVSTDVAGPYAPGISRQIAPPSHQIIESTDASRSQTKFGLNAGAGLRFQLTGFSTFIEARWHTAFTGGEHTQFVPISVGITF